MEASHNVYRFENAVLDVSNVRLTVNGEQRALEPKSFRLLQFLVENAARVVTKEELLAAIWAETYVSDNAITRAITQVRKALEDDPRHPRFIETVPTVGYRFLPGVQVEAPEPKRELSQLPQIPDQAGGNKIRIPPWVWPVTVAAIAVLALAVGTRFSERPAFPVFASHQFTTSTGLDISATFSPDGNLVAYASDRTGRLQIYVRSLDGSARDLMLTSGTGQSLYPSFSPDGRTIAFCALNGSGIFRVSALGGSVERLSEFGTQPVWSPDGQWIVFRSAAAPSLSTTDLYYPATSSLWLMHADGSGLRQITNEHSPAGGQAFPSWSRDSQEIRFANYKDQETDMYAFLLATGQMRKLFRASQQTGFGSAIFRRDDRSMFYVSSRLNGDISIFEQPLDPKTLTPKGLARSVFQPSVGVPRDLSLSADGETLAYSAILSDSRLLVTHLRNGEPEPGEPENISQESNFRYLHPSWSMDGKSVAFTAFRKGNAPKIFLLAYPEGTLREVSSDPAEQIYSLFDPSGHSLYYSARAPNQESVLKQFDLEEGMSKTVVRLPANMRQMSLNPRRPEIAFNYSSDNFSHLWKIDLKTGQKRQLTFGNTDTGYPRYSHDGKWICFQQMERGKSNLAVMPADGPEPEAPLARGIYYASDWSPDNSKVLYAAFTNGLWNVAAMDRDSRVATQMTRNTNARVYLRYPAWSRDGARIVYEYNESRGNVYLAKLK